MFCDPLPLDITYDPRLISIPVGLILFTIIILKGAKVGIKFLRIQKKKSRGWKAKLAALYEEMRQLNNTAARKAEALEYWESLDP